MINSGVEVARRGANIKKEIARFNELSKRITGKPFSEMVAVDNRNLEKGMGLMLKIDIKHALSDYVKTHKVALSKSDRNSLELTKAEREVLAEVESARYIAYMDGDVVVITVWKLPPTVNMWSKAYTSDKQHFQGVWDGIMRKATATLKKPFKVPVLIEYTSYRQRPVDVDNNSFKNVVDALKHNWVLPDDTPAHLRRCLPDQVKVKSKEEQRIELKIHSFPKDAVFSWEIKKK
jgi:Holliday junction resolvase RusA-like endonuclease